MSGAPPWLPGIPRIDARWHSAQPRAPRGIGLHCTESGGDPVRYLQDPGDGRPVSYHLVLRPHLVAPAAPPYGWVQMVALDRRAYHASSWGNGDLGICLPGPAETDPRPGWQLDALVWLLELLQPEARELTRWWRHSDDPRARRRDPGPGVGPDWVAALAVWGLRAG